MSVHDEMGRQGRLGLVAHELIVVQVWANLSVSRQGGYVHQLFATSHRLGNGRVSHERVNCKCFEQITGNVLAMMFALFFQYQTPMCSYDRSFHAQQQCEQNATIEHAPATTMISYRNALRQYFVHDLRKNNQVLNRLLLIQCR